MAWAAGIGALSGMGAGVGGALAQNKASKRAANLAEEASARFMGIQDPNYEEMRLKLEQLKQMGLLTPEMENSIMQGGSALDSYTEDPRLRQAELDALGQLSKISNEGGMDAQARLGQEQARMSAQQQARGSRDANMMNAAQRGVAGSGLEFTSNQMADQNAANTSYMAGLQNAAAANERDMAALNGLSNVGGQMRTQDFSQAQAKAKAMDDISRFNTEAQQSVQQRNVSARNAAQESNLKESQRIADQNTMLRNQEQQYNNSLQQQKFDNSMQKAQGAAGLVGNQVNAINAQGQAAANLWGGIGKGLSAAGSAYADYETDEKKKK